LPIVGQGRRITVDEQYLLIHERRLSLQHSIQRCQLQGDVRRFVPKCCPRWARASDIADVHPPSPETQEPLNRANGESALCKLTRIDDSASHVVRRLLNQPQMFPRFVVAA
jgi:hypothetical protein